MSNAEDDYPFTPLPGERAKCEDDIIGRVKAIELTDSGLLWKGHPVGSPTDNWQSKDPVDPYD